jgi:hypothetical protein
MTDQDHTFVIDDAEGAEVEGVEGAASARPGDVLPPSADDAAAIDSFLSGYGRGFQVSIVRTAPVWCAGYLTTLPMDHGITLNEIRESFGGRRFQLRILTDQGRYVAMRTVLIADVPRDNGKPIGNMDRAEPEAPPRANPSPSGFGELAGVFRDLLASQQAASDRQAALLERFIGQPVAQAQAAILSPLAQIQQLGEVIAAVRELAPAVVAETPAGGAANGEALMMKLAEKLITKWGDKSSGAPPKGRAPGGAPGGAPGARRPPIIIQGGPRPPGIPAAPVRVVEAAPPVVRNPAPAAPADAPLDTPNDSGSAPAPTNEPSTADCELADGEEYTAEDVRDLLAGMPVDDAAQVIRDVFDGLSDEDKEKAFRIVSGMDETDPNEENADVDNPSTVDP